MFLNKAGVALSSELKTKEMSSIVETVKSLRDIKVRPDDTNMPTPAKPLLKNLKYQLRDLIINVLNDKNIQREAPKKVQQIIIENLNTNEIKVEKPKDMILSDKSVLPDYAYGDIYEIVIEQPFPKSNLIIATITLGICCGEDTSLYIFKKNIKGWDIIFSDEVNDYDTIDVARGSFNYGILGQSNDDLFIVTANINPWCTSNWQKIRYNVFKINCSIKADPKIILNENRWVYLGVKPPPYKLKTGPNEFTLEFYGGENSNPDGTAPLQQIKYKVKGVQVERVQ